jgi:anti-sigma regulatory factor (Ser/Thr protein kinase)
MNGIIYKDSLQKNGYNGAATDKSGKIRLIFSKSNGSLELKCSNLGFNQYKLILDQTNNYQIDVFLAKQGLGIPIYKQIDTLKIIEFGKNYFIVKEKTRQRNKMD